MKEAVNLAQKLSQFSDHWSPRVIAAVNDQQLKLVKLAGEFVWHDHQGTDEAFIVVDGEMLVSFRDLTSGCERESYSSSRRV